MNDFSGQLIRFGMSPAAAARQGAHLEACDTGLGSLGAGRRRWSVWVPGRVELLGKHTDYAGGRSLLCAVERGFVVRAALRSDRFVRAIDVRTGETSRAELAASTSEPGDGWQRYVCGVARRLARNFPGTTRGVDLAFHSDLPVAAGMSSSSALMIAVFVSLAKSNDLRSSEEFRREISSREELAAYLGCIENGQNFRSLEGDAGVGTFGGSQDHTAIMCSEPGRVVQYSFGPVRREAVFQMPPTVTLVVASSGVIAEKASGARGAYNRLSLVMQHLLRAWNARESRSDGSIADAIRSGGDAPRRLRELAAQQRGIDFTPEELVARFDQFMLETFEIIPAAGAALARGTIGDLGELVDRSQQAAETSLRNQTPETITLAQQARELGAIASSSFGAGFGGSVWALVPVGDAVSFAARWHDAYVREFPALSDAAEFFVSPLGPGAMQW
jgi:galactokinase